MSQQVVPGLGHSGLWAGESGPTLLGLGQEMGPWAPVWMGWAPQGHFLSRNILPCRQQEGRQLSPGGRKGPGLGISSDRALGDPGGNGLVDSRALELGGGPGLPRPERPRAVAGSSPLGAAAEPSVEPGQAAQPTAPLRAPGGGRQSTA